MARLTANKFGDKLPEWDKAKVITYRSKQMVEVPLLYNNIQVTYSVQNPLFKEVKTGQKSVTKGLFFIKNGEVSSMFIMKLALDERYSSERDKEIDFANLSFNNLRTDGFTGYLMLTDWNEKVLESYCHKEGKIIGTTSQKVAVDLRERRQQCYD